MTAVQVQVELGIEPGSITGDATMVGADMVGHLLRPAVLQVLAQLPAESHTPLMAGLFAGMVAVAHNEVGQADTLAILEIYVKAVREYQFAPEQGGR